MIKKQIFLSLFLLVLLGTSFGQSASKRLIDFTEFNLENGLHVILHQDNTSPVVAINVMYHVGSKNEKPNRTGFAHFFEHLMFEGTENIPRGQYMKIVQNAGGTLNAATSFDYTFYYETLPSNQLELGLWLESERMLHPKIDHEGVETQRKVIKEERSSSYDNQPYGSLLEKIFSNAFKEHPYRWIPIGSRQYIDEAKLDEFIEFHNHFYVPGNAVLVIAGDIDTSKTRELVKKYFAGIPAGNHEIYRPNVNEPAQEKEIRDTVYDNIQLPAVVMAYKMPERGSKDYYALDMLQNLLSGGQSSRLYKTLVDNQQVANYVSAFPYALEEAGLFIIFGLANFGVPVDQVEQSLLEEIEKVKTSGLSQNEFEKLQNQTENAYISSNSTYSGIAQSLSVNYTLFKDANRINTEYNNYLQVTREDIQKVAQKYLVKENRVVLTYLPKNLEK